MAGEAGTSGLAPLRVRDFRLLFLGHVLSASLMPLQFISQIFWIQDNFSADYRLILVGLIGSMRGAGALTFGLYGGALADRFDRRKLLIATQSLAITLNLSIAGLMLTSDPGPAVMVGFFGLTFIASGLFAIDAPTRQAMVPDLLGPRLTPGGISLNTAGMQIAMPVSIFASGFVIDSLGFSAAYALSTIGLAGEVTALILMHYKSTIVPRAGSYGFRRTIGDVVEGYRYTRSNPTVFWIIALMISMMALGFPAVANLGPTWITTVVGVSVRNFGFVALTWGLGAFFASLTMTRFSHMESRGRLLCLGALGFSASFVVFAIPTVPTAVIGNLGLGISLALAQISSMTLVQHLVPNEVRGRVMSLLQLNQGFAQLMTLPLAAIAQAASLRMLFPVLAATVVCIVVLVVVIQRHLWSARTGAPPLAAVTPATTAAR